jgi:hypothetical protein
MTEREEELANNLNSANAETSVLSAIELCDDFLFPRKEFEKAELILLERVGVQTMMMGNIVELALGEVYIGLEELPRAKRFLESAVVSKVEEIRSRAQELLASIESSS